MNADLNKTPVRRQLDWLPMAVPFFFIVILCLCFVAFPEASRDALAAVRSFLDEVFGNLVSGRRPGNLPVFSLSGFFPLWLPAPRETGRTAEILRFRLGLNDVYLRPGRRYPVLFPL